MSPPRALAKVIAEFILHDEGTHGAVERAAVYCYGYDPFRLVKRK
jgi:hypothetical protein